MAPKTTVCCVSKFNFSRHTYVVLCLYALRSGTTLTSALSCKVVSGKDHSHVECFEILISPTTRLYDLGLVHPWLRILSRKDVSSFAMTTPPCRLLEESSRQWVSIPTSFCGHAAEESTSLQAVSLFDHKYIDDQHSGHWPATFLTLDLQWRGLLGARYHK